jgi:hypothetical protein
LARAPITLDGRKSADKLVLVAPTQRQEPRDLTESDGWFAIDNRLHYCWSEKCEAETLSDKAVRSFYWSALFHIESSVRVTVEAVRRGRYETPRAAEIASAALRIFLQ